jgi:hypothetical protein
MGPIRRKVPSQWDANQSETIRQTLLYHGADCTPYEGLSATGWPVMNLLRSEVAMKNGTLLAKNGQGQFLPAISCHLLCHGEPENIALQVVRCTLFGQPISATLIFHAIENRFFCNHN